MKIIYLRSQLFIVLLTLFFPEIIYAQNIDFSKAGILASAKIKSPVRETIVKMLQEEVAKRTSINLQLFASSGKNQVIALAVMQDERIDGLSLPKRDGKNLPEAKAEGYRIVIDSQSGKQILWLIGADDRGLLFAAGDFLRKANLEKNKILFDKKDEIATAPMQIIRGHQLGYRATNNSTDAWSVAQYEQYIRDLIIFGTNAVEMIPAEKEKRNSLMQLAPDEMNIEVSKICQKYGIDYWVWTPTGCDMKDQAARAKDLDTKEDFYKKCPKLDDVFFPGGDPGDNHPREVLPYLKELYGRLIKYHPHAGMWISLQGFSEEQIDYFYAYLRENNPDWLKGVVSGPSSPSIAATRFRLPAKYKHRLYPDITHNVRCDYPIRNWDQAYMLTYGREGICPMPNYYATIQAKYAPYSDGFISYSDGCHDDVNKVTWSMRGWDINMEPQTIMEDYCRYFFGPRLAQSAANGIMALEMNWNGPIRKNGGIETAFDHWKKLEIENPQLAGNWRWQMLLVRSYYDTYQRRRKFYEQDLENKANEMLATAPEIGSGKAMQQALEVLKKADTEPMSKDIHAKIVKYLDELFRSCGYQSDVKKYQASNPQRSCILTFLDYPLNNRWWLEDEFKKVDTMQSEQEKLARLNIIRTWGNPGKGSFYDNISNIENSPHCTTTSEDATDVAWWDGGMSRKRLSSQLYQQNPELNYEDLDPNGRYRIRVSGRGDALLRVDGERLDPIVYDKEIGGFKEFVVPMDLVGDGKIHVSFDRPEESKIRWSQQSHVSDVWLLKQ